jgi:S-DNA-T family DNA segregation ATPase FtsK/SpoIIIE
VGKRTKRRFVPVEAKESGLSAWAWEAVALLALGVSLFVLVALATFSLADPGEAIEIPRGGGRNLAGVVGYHVAHAFLFVFGHAAYVLVLFGCVYAVLVLLHRGPSKLVFRSIGALVFTSMMALLLAGPHGMAGASEASPYGAGGRLGANLSPHLHDAFGGSGRILFLVFGALFAFLLATEWLFSALLRGVLQAIHRGARKVHARWAEAAAARAARAEADEADEEDEDGAAGEDSDEEAADDEGEDEQAEHAEGDESEADERAVAARRGADAEDEVDGADRTAPEAEASGGADAPEEPVVELPRPRRSLKLQKPRRRKPARTPAPSSADYRFPPATLFREPPVSDDSAAQEEIERNARAIERRLASFKVSARVVGVSQGPAVTQYELRLAEGIKVSRVTSFEADLAAALKAVSVRVVAPIPGRDTVGVEVPNLDRQIVVMRELLEQFGRADDLAIPLFLGKDVAGEPIVEDLARMPHLLIAGTTGSGKSVCINTILLSVLMTRTPAQVRLILIDPKMVELQHYRKVPHLSCEVVSNMKKAPGVLEWAVEEMEKRYALLSAVGVNHIRSYNNLGVAELERRLQRPADQFDAQLPYQVVVIDELADLMAVSQKEVEESIQRLAQKSRAVGLHVIIATQRPSTDVITGVIKANLPCQIAFKVNRKIDSRVILDANGAEKLLGHGDMLYVPPGAQRMMRAQATYVAEDEIERVVQFLEENGPKPAFIPDLVQTKTGKKRGARFADDLYEQAVEVVLGQQRGSATLLQRALAVGYTRATRLLEMMEEDGIVGPFAGSKSREVLLTLEEWQAREAAVAEELSQEWNDADAEADADAEDEVMAEREGRD